MPQSTDCRSLGHVLGGQFCTRCGAPLVPVAQTQEKSVGPKGRRNLLVIGVIILSVAVIGLLALLPGEDSTATEVVEVDRDLLGDAVGDCKFYVSGDIFVGLTRQEFENVLRRDGCSEQRVSEELANFSANQEGLREWHAEQAARGVQFESFTDEELAYCAETADPDMCEGKRNVVLTEAILTQEQVLTSFERAQLGVHLNRLAEMEQVITTQYADAELTLDEARFICALLPRWEMWLEGAEAYLTELGQSGLRGVAIEVLRTRIFVDDFRLDCSGSVSSPAVPPTVQPTNTPVPTTQPTSTPPPIATPSVPLSISSGRVHRDHWYEAAERCDTSEMAEWSDEIWQDTTLVYMGATIFVSNYSPMDSSLSPEDLRTYREFMNGTRTFAANEWSSLFDTQQRLSETIARATRVLSSGSLLVDDYFTPDFPSAWLATYHEVLPLLRDMSFAEGTLTHAIEIPQGWDDNPVLSSLGLFKNQFDCQTAGLQN